MLFTPLTVRGQVWHCQTAVRCTANFGTAKLPYLALLKFCKWHCQIWHCQATVRGSAKLGSATYTAVWQCQVWQCHVRDRGTAKFGTAKLPYVALLKLCTWLCQIGHCLSSVRRMTPLISIKFKGTIILKNKSNWQNTTFPREKPDSPVNIYSKTSLLAIHEEMFFR